MCRSNSIYSNISFCIFRILKFYYTSFAVEPPIADLLKPSCCIAMNNNTWHPWIRKYRVVSFKRCFLINPATSPFNFPVSPVYGTKSSYVAFRLVVIIGLNTRLFTVAPLSPISILIGILPATCEKLNICPLPLSAA